jgi:hypothetical protein
MESREAFIRVAGVSFKQEAVRESNVGDRFCSSRNPTTRTIRRRSRCSTTRSRRRSQIGYIPRDRTVVFHLLMDSAALQGVEIASMGEAKDSGIIGIMIRAEYDHETLQAFIANREPPVGVLMKCLVDMDGVIADIVPAWLSYRGPEDAGAVAGRKLQSGRDFRHPAGVGLAGLR